MKERGIIFSGPMVRAILDGRKTQTRRVMNPQPDTCKVNVRNIPTGYLACPYGLPGDLLYVKETWAVDSAKIVHYRASEASPPKEKLSSGREVRTIWRSSRFMPKWAARLWLRLTEVRVQRVQDISHEDCVAEGVYRDILPRCGDHPDLECWVWGPVPAHAYVASREAYEALWDAVNANRGFGWDENPWVWALTFERVTPPAAQEEA